MALPSILPIPPVARPLGWNLAAGRLRIPSRCHVDSDQGDLALRPAVEFRDSARSAKGMVINLAYVGSRGTHLTVERQLNQLRPLPLAKILSARMSR